jgi:3-hydroxyisobutyrate dehydrogenase-like beta-hydroxyacid dehydrogenase
MTAGRDVPTACRRDQDKGEQMAGKVVVGFAGLGHAGWPMAANVVAAGFDVVVYDVDGERERAFAREHGCGSAGSPEGLAGVEVLITMLPNGHVVRELVLGSGLVERLAPGTLVIDTSSSDPAGTRELGAELAARGLHLLDAPVTMPEVGGAPLRRITIMVGGDDEEALDRAEPILASMCTWLFRTGALGTGHAMKTLNNYVSAAGLVAGLDALVIGYRAGLDPMTMMEVMRVGTGRNFSTSYALPEQALTRRHGMGFSLGLLVKDLGIAKDLAEDVGFETALPALVRDDLADALAALGFDVDHTEALRHWEDRAGVALPEPAAS